MLPSKPSGRTWMDDCTASAQGAAAAIGLVEAVGSAAASMECMRSRVNVTKSGVATTTPFLTAMMRQAVGPLFGCAEAFKDLGVV